MGAKRAAVQTVLDLPVSPREELFKIISFFGWEGTMVNLQHPFFLGGSYFYNANENSDFSKIGTFTDFIGLFKTKFEDARLQMTAW